MQAQKTILMVEDELSLLEPFVNILKQEGFLALKAENGKEGVEIALSKHPDLILLDLIMPEMDGIAAFKKIREDSWGANVPVIILTNLSATDEQLVGDVVKYKPFYYLIKTDWKIHDVIQKIKEVLKI